MDYALRHQERVASLVLCGTPLTMPRNLLRLQDFLFRLMPERAFAGSGFSPGGHASAGWLHGRAGPPSPAAGAELSGAGALRQQGPRQPQGCRELAKQLPQARLHWIAGAGHEANLDSPEVMAELLRGFYQSLS